MGAYLSAPNTEKLSSNDANDYLQVGASSMQGWRISQEDAHNCILDFDATTSLFSVYDGHGGAEVAVYCAERLPAFLKDLPAYKAGDFEQALKDAFLGFDKTLLEDEVIEELKRLAEKNPNQDSEVAEDEEEEDLMELCQEGSLPLDQVLEKYKGCAAAKFPHLNKLKQDEAGGSGISKPLSPFLRGRRNLAETQNAVEAAVKFAGDAGCGPSSSISSTLLCTKGSSSMPDLGIGDSFVSSSCGKSDASAASSKISLSAKPAEIVHIKSADSSEVSSAANDVNGTASPVVVVDSSSNDAVRSPDSEASPVVKTKVQNGDITSSSFGSDNECKSWPDEGNGEVSSNTKLSTVQDEVATVGSASVKWKSGSVTSGISSSTAVAGAGGSSAIGNAKPQAHGDMDDSSSDDDVDFHAEEENSSTEDGEEDCEAFDEDLEEEDEETEDDEEGLLDDDDTAFCRNMIEEPGKDSGCTAVVALINGRDLYVANAGDSRCVVCRNGKAIEMSFDHKPEDDEETERILIAGGKVTLDGRVNGGLNLSRAIGDHAYKMNQDLSPEKQMITSLPDVRKLIISPEDEFMILACDGIWNFMSSDEVVEFVKKRLDEGYDKLSQICEELFDHCLAPNTMGDGTGCDNMTAVLVCFKPALRNLSTKISVESEAVPVATSLAKKRSATAAAAASVPNESEEETNSLEENESSSSEALLQPTSSPLPTVRKRAASPTRSDGDIPDSAAQSAESSSSTDQNQTTKRMKTDNEAVMVSDSSDSIVMVATNEPIPDENVPMSTVAISSSSSSTTGSSTVVVADASTSVEKESITPTTSTT